MIETCKIEYAGATIEVCSFLKDKWPHDMKPEQWPTFCGAGNGIGDKIVPDHIHGIPVSFLCFDHDCGFAIGPDTKEAWHSHNKRLYRNLLSVIISSPLQGKELIAAVNECAVYFLFVESPLGWANFCPCGDDPKTNPEIKKTLLRLHEAECVAIGVAA